MENMNKKVYVIATGGTISAGGKAGKTTGYNIGAFGIETLLSGIPLDACGCGVECEQFFNISSDDITVAHWLALASRINALAKDDDIAGFVVTHGTNTLEETAYFLNLTVKTKKPVIVTGAMYPATAPCFDGAQNLYEAIALAANENASQRGVMVLFADGIYSSRDVRKENPYRMQAFGGADAGLLGFMQDERAYFLHGSDKRHTCMSEFDTEGKTVLPRVDIAYFYADAPAEQLDYIGDGVNGLVIAGAGGGFCSEAWKTRIKALTDAGMPVIRATKLCNGVVSADDIDRVCGTIPAGTLYPQKARILLMLALTVSSDPAYIAQLLERY